MFTLMKTQGWIIKIFVVFFAVLAVILFFIAGFLFLKKDYNINYQSQPKFSAEADRVKNTPPPLSTVEVKPSVRMLFFGDMMLDRNVGALIKQKGLDYLFEKTSKSENSVFQNQDIIACNLEGAVTNGGQHYSPQNSFDFAFSPDVVDGLKTYGFNFFNLANNHFFDQGQVGAGETRRNLDSLGFSYAGCPDGQIGDCSIKILSVKNRQIGLAGFSSIYSALDQEQLKNAISALAAKTDFVIVNMHWGVEYQHQFSQLQRETAHNLIDAGADLVIGHHPHVIQGMEIYKGKPIFYSLGNFIFDQYFSSDTQEGLALDIELTVGQIKFFLLPIGSNKSQVSLLAGAERGEFLKRFGGWSLIDSKLLDSVVSGQFTLLNN